MLNFEHHNLNKKPFVQPFVGKKPRPLHVCGRKHCIIKRQTRYVNTFHEGEGCALKVSRLAMASVNYLLEIEERPILSTDCLYRLKPKYCWCCLYFGLIECNKCIYLQRTPVSFLFFSGSKTEVRCVVTQ